MNNLSVDWLVWGFIIISSCFLSIHSIITPTPAEEEKYLRKNPKILGVYPWHDKSVSRSDLFELGDSYAKRLRIAGSIGLILTIAVALLTFIPFYNSIFLDSSQKSIYSGCFCLVIIWILRCVEKGTWPFKMKKDEGMF